jgi:hypothetical protein
VSPNGHLVPTDHVHEETLAPKSAVPTKLRLRSSDPGQGGIALLPLMYQTTCDAAYFGGIDT